MNQETLAIVFQIAGFVTAVVLGVIIIPNILFISHKKRLYDQPDARKIHKTPIPRLGGAVVSSGDYDYYVPESRDEVVVRSDTEGDIL